MSLSGYKSNVKYQCFECSYTSQWVFAFTTHMRRCHHEISYPSDCSTEIDCYQCEICGYKTGLRIQLLKHLKWDHPTESFSKDIEDSFIKQELLLIKPEIQEFDVAEYHCFCCKLMTFSKVFLTKHVESCKGKHKPLLSCNYEVKKESNLERYDKNLLKLLLKKLKCQYCDYQAKFKGDLKKHLINKHTTADKGSWLECKKCAYKTRVMTSLKRHQITKHASHDEINWLQCQDCDYQAKFNNELKRHRINKHTTEDKVEWFKCKDCPYKSRMKYSLKRHQLNKHAPHDEIKWFKCEDCYYQAKLKGELQKHRINKHTPEDKVLWFECHDCDFKSRMKTGLKRHNINKHAFDDEIKWFKCRDCEFQGKSNKSLIRHRKSKHRK